jgi:hypothetical protein
MIGVHGAVTYGRRDAGRRSTVWCFDIEPARAADLKDDLQAIWAGKLESVICHLSSVICHLSSGGLSGRPRSSVSAEGSLSPRLPRPSLPGSTGHRRERDAANRRHGNVSDICDRDGHDGRVRRGVQSARRIVCGLLALLAGGALRPRLSSRQQSVTWHARTLWDPARPRSTWSSPGPRACSWILSSLGCKSLLISLRISARAWMPARLAGPAGCRGAGGAGRGRQTRLRGRRHRRRPASPG